MECIFSFGELKIPGYGDGILVDGTVVLKPDGDDDFYVAAIEFQTGNYRKTITHKSEDGFDRYLFRKIEAVLHDTRNPSGKYAASEWADVVEDYRASARFYSDTARNERRETV